MWAKTVIFVSGFILGTFFGKSIEKVKQVEQFREVWGKR